jgi:hypothetical protein
MSSQVFYCLYLLKKKHTNPEHYRRAALAFLFMQKNKSKPRLWVHPINRNRETFGEFHHLVNEFRSHEDRFFKYFRMTLDSFDLLVNMVNPIAYKKSTNWRNPISIEERLAVTLR